MRKYTKFNEWLSIRENNNPVSQELDNLWHVAKNFHSNTIEELRNLQKAPSGSPEERGAHGQKLLKIDIRFQQFVKMIQQSNPELTKEASNLGDLWQKMKNAANNAIQQMNRYSQGNFKAFNDEFTPLFNQFDSITNTIRSQLH